MKKFLFVFGVILLGNSCEKGMDITADYQQIPVIYGLLDIDKTDQYIRIQKTFLGEINALEAAKISDSSYYKNISPVIKEYNSAGDVTETINLSRVLLPERDSGDFFTEPNYVYHFSNNGRLEAGKRYELTYDDGTNIVSASTPLLESTGIALPRRNSSTSFISNNIRNNPPAYSNEGIEVSPVKNARRYEMALTFEYVEEKVTGERENKSIEFDIDVITVKKLNSSARSSVSGSQFFTAVSELVKVDTTVKQREIGSIIFNVKAGTDDLNTYIEANQPLSGVVLEKNSFTNVYVNQDKGVGIFASTSSDEVKTFLSLHTHRALALMGITKDLNFCSTLSSIPNEDSDIKCK